MEQHFEKEIHGGQFGEIHNHYAKKDEPIPHSHLTVTCPQCGGESYRFNEYCYNGKCTFGIKQYFDYQEWQEKEQRRKALLQKQSQRLVIFTLVGFVICLLGLYLGSLHPVGYLVFFVAGYLALVFNKAGQHVEKEIKEIGTEEYK
jgi:hypothetical protein|nr:MAG TPA: baseplate protein [Caudoviricetes sp.]